MTNTIVLDSSIFTDPNMKSLGVRTRLGLIFLYTKCDRNGVIKYEDGILELSLNLSASIGGDRFNLKAEKLVLKRLEHLKLIHQFWLDGLLYIWVPNFPSSQPNRGSLKPKDLGNIPPPDNEVVLYLSRAMGREPTKKECKSISPATYGKRASAASVHSEIMAVWEEWKNRQKRPGACSLNHGTTNLIRGTLKSISVEQARLLIRFAYEADHPMAKVWRGHNDRKRTYLGLENIFRKTKLPARIQVAEEWAEKESMKLMPGEDDFGPMAKFKNMRLGPPGTTSDFKDRPARLNNQQSKMIALFRERGSSGVLTTELVKIALRYSSRLCELRGMGYDISIVERNENGVNKYVLHGEVDDMDR